MHTSGGIMLAPKKVQEQYTSTKTTSKLDTHGLLEDASRKAIGNGNRNGDKSRRTTLLEKEKRREKEKEDAKKAKAKAKEKKKELKKNSDRERASNPTEGTESSTATSSAGSISASQVIPAPARATTSKIAFAPSIRPPVKAQSTSGPSSPETSSTFDHSSRKLLQSTSSTSLATSHIRGHRDSIDSDEYLPTRTPHAEAFGTLDPNDIEHLRRAQKPTDGSSSFANRIFRRFRGAANRADNITQPVATPQNAYSPPWIVTAGRDQNEEHVRVLTDLNNSFRDVGLLHTQPSHRVGKSAGAGGGGAKKRMVTNDIFDFVPEDSLYMLLPLWAGETDPGGGSGVGSGSIMAGSSSISEASASTTATAATTVTSATLLTIPEDRQFLLVWYVPFEDKKKNPSSSNYDSSSNSASSSANKKKLKQHLTSDPDAESNQKNVYLRNFRVNARLVGYDELRGTGIRVPSDGLAVAAPPLDVGGLGGVRDQEESESQLGLGQPQLEPQSGTETALGLKTVTICMCSSREKGFHFQIEGLCKLGLCLQEEVTLPAANNPQAVYLEIPTSEMRHLLTPVGRAAVEMVWLGCLAITSFGPY
jgi:hypothetical protein